MQLKVLLQNFAARPGVFEHLPWILALAFTAAISYRLAELTWRLVPTPEFADTVTPEVGDTPVPVRKAVPETSISQWSLFGKVEVAPVPQVDVPIEVPETRLNLTLLGVIASSSPATAKAIISDPSGNEEYYSVGMAVPGGATLEEIHTDHVMLKRNNRLEVLRLPQEEGFGGPGAGQAALDVDSQPRTRRILPPTIGGDARSTGAILRQYRDALNQDPQSVMDLVRAEPYREGDRLVGFRINPGRDRQMLSRFGLRPGDVVTAVNGVKLDNPVKGLELIQNLQTANQVSVEVLRNGVTQSFSFAVE
jgi:general secretion pathway protein C